MRDTLTDVWCFRCGAPVYRNRYALGGSSLCGACESEAREEFMEDTELNKEEFSERLKDWRARHEYTQQEASLALGVLIDTYRTWEHGTYMPRGETLETILEKTRS